MARLLTLRRTLARLLTPDEVDDNIINVATDFTGAVDPATVEGAYVLPFMRWADTGTGWLRRRNAANNAWVNEQRLHRTSLPVYAAGEVPTEDIGVICIQGRGLAEWDSDQATYRSQSNTPVGKPGYWPLRASIPAGEIPQDGQTVPRVLFPDLTAMVVAGTLPVVSEAEWLADPQKRGSYTLGDGATTIRVPDLNGKSAGSLGAVVWRGDGALSAGTGGSIQRDALQNLTGTVQFRNLSDQTAIMPLADGIAAVSSASGVEYARITAPATGAVSALSVVSFDASRVARTAIETRMLSVTGVWTVQAFGAVINPGSADAAQLASDYAVLNAAVQTLDGTVQTLQALLTRTFGVGQSWQNVGPNRAFGVNYPNSTGRPILVNVEGTVSAADANYRMGTNSRLADRTSFPASFVGAVVGKTLFVPADDAYSINQTGISNTSWWEYR